ncbi:hypothetical protein ACF0H5_022771 [Mactra antiquata]
MEKIFIFITLVAIASVYGGRIELLEKKVLAMEASLHQDILMLRDSVQTINDKLDNVHIMNDKLDKILQLHLLPQESDVPNTEQTFTTLHNEEKPGLVSSTVGRMQHEMRRIKRAFSDLKYDVKLNQDMNTIKLSKSLTRTRTVINETMNDVRDNVITATTQLNFNVSSFINETNNRALSLIDAATTERHVLIEDIKNEVHILKANQELNMINFSESLAKIRDIVNKTIIDATDNVITATTQLDYNVSSFINETNNRALSLVEAATNERRALIVDVKNEIRHVATKESTSQILTVSRNIMDAVVHALLVLISNKDSIRLRDYTIDRTSNTVRGRLEVFYDNTWGTVCDDVFHESNTGAQVACRQLGLTGGTPIGAFGSGIDPIWLDDVQCIGTESNIFLCPRSESPIGSHNCQHSEDVGVKCTIPVSII